MLLNAVKKMIEAIILTALLSLVIALIVYGVTYMPRTPEQYKWNMDAKFVILVIVFGMCLSIVIKIVTEGL